MIYDVEGLKDLWSQRASHYGNDHALMDVLVGIYNGSLPGEFDEFFPEGMHVHLINMIRMAWDDLAWLGGKEFPIYVAPEGNNASAKERAERLEKWAYGVNRAGRRAGGVTMKSLMKSLMWWLVGCANAVVMTLPDYENKSPFFTLRDPRTHYPPVGWTPWNETKADDALFAYQKSLAQLKIEYPHIPDSTWRRAKSGVTYSLNGPNVTHLDDDATWLWTGEYYAADCWMVSTLEDKAVELVRSEKGDRGHPGVQPVTAMGLYNPDTSKGRSLFADQVSIQAAMARMFSQKLDYFDRTLYPMIFTTPLAGKTIKVGPYAVNEFDFTMGMNPRVDAVGPTNAIDADQTMQFAMGLSRMLNRNPEQLQGAGPADSAKALEKLMEGVNNTIRDGLWPSAIETLPSLYTAAAKMELRLWPNAQKRASGSRKNADFQLTYTPRVLLKGHEHDFDIEPGVGLAGYQGMLEILQLVGAELMSEDTALEQGEWSRNAHEEKIRIHAMRMEKMLWADLQQRAAAPPGTPGALMPGALGELHSMVVDKGEDLFESIKRLDQAGRLFVAAPDPASDPLAAMLGGGGAPGAGPALPPPDLAALGRGA